MALPYIGMDFVPFDILTAEELDHLVANIDALAAGTGLNDLAIATAKLADLGVTAAKLANASITPSKLALGDTTAAVATVETTSSATFADLATVGPSVTATVGANGRALVILTADASNTMLNGYAVMGFTASGASTVAASSARALYNKAAVANNNFRASCVVPLTGLTPGSTTITAKYETLGGGVATIGNREITFIPL